MTTTLAPHLDPAALADELRRWFAGSPARVVVLGAGETLPAGVAPDACVLHARGDDPGTDQAVAYDGALEYGGGEVSVGDDLIVQLEGYATAQYVSVACPTVVSVLDDVDREVLVADALAARSSGAFPHHLVHPLVVVRDELAWIRAEVVAPEDAALLAGPDGPAVQRFLGAARLLRAMRRRATGALTVDGFGGDATTTATTATTAAAGTTATARRDSTFVLRDDAGAYVADAVTGSMARVSDDVAAVVQGTLDGVALDAPLVERLGGAHVVPALLAALGVSGGTGTGVGGGDRG